jgi:hypothetical protein
MLHLGLPEIFGNDDLGESGSGATEAPMFGD